MKKIFKNRKNEETHKLVTTHINKNHVLLYILENERTGAITYYSSENIDDKFEIVEITVDYILNKYIDKIVTYNYQDIFQNLAYVCYDHEDECYQLVADDNNTEILGATYYDYHDATRLVDELNGLLD